MMHPEFLVATVKLHNCEYQKDLHLASIQHLKYSINFCIGKNNTIRKYKYPAVVALMTPCDLF